MRAITSHKSELTAAIAKIYGRFLQYAADDQIHKLIFDCYDNATKVSEISGMHLSRIDGSATIYSVVKPDNKIDALRTLAILANIAADREMEKTTVLKIESELHQTIHGSHAD